ncbi:MAG: hydrogenase maturation nickel metallochaperone HypA [Anaerolineae bacterium]|nr:hydrogenase maturation nickel metallochaperone HypA [Anaerolineae bacterium]
MHELSIAHSLVEIAGEAACQANAKQVEAVTLRLGALSGVVKDALLFSYDIAIENTLLAGSRLYIEELPVVVYCPDCDTQTTLDGVQRFRCDQCGQPTAQIIQGKEMEIVSLEYTE